MPLSTPVAAFGNSAMLALILVATAMIVAEQIALLPPPPPTPVESNKARPEATRRWRIAAARLQARFPDRPLETGEVWATRTGRICGFVNKRASNTDDMERFFTTPELDAHFKDEDIDAFMPIWKACLDDRWVELHAGSEQTGFCASAHARSTRIARDYLCVNWTAE
jgi:hypothetical protein